MSGLHHIFKLLLLEITWCVVNESDDDEEAMTMQSVSGGLEKHTGMHVNARM